LLEGERLILPGYDYSSGLRDLQLQRESENLTVRNSFPLDYYLPGKNETKRTLIFSALLDVQWKKKKKRQQ